MKILVLSPLYYPDRFGGIEKVAFELSSRLKLQNLEVVVVCGTASASVTEDFKGVRIHRVQSTDAFNNGSFEKYYEVNQAALQIITVEEPDIIWVHDWFFALAALNYSERNNVRIFSQAHVLKRYESKNRISTWRAFVDLMQNLLFRNSELVLCISNSQFQVLNQYYRIPKVKIARIQYGLDEIIQDDLERPTSKTLTFLYLGRFESEKNLENFFSAVCEFEKGVEQRVKIVLMGSGSLQNKLESLSKEFKNTEVLFLPFDSNSLKVREQIQSSDVLILPSFYDSYGLSALEAISLGVPVMVSKQCGISEDLVHYPKALLFDAFSKVEIKKSLQFCLENSTCLKSLGKYTRSQFLKTHNWDLCLNQILHKIGLEDRGIDNG